MTVVFISANQCLPGKNRKWWKTPESSGMKGDHLVGKYYVLFEKNYKEQVEKLIQNVLTRRKLKILLLL